MFGKSENIYSQKTDASKQQTFSRNYRKGKEKACREVTPSQSVIPQRQKRIVPFIVHKGKAIGAPPRTGLLWRITAPSKSTCNYWTQNSTWGLPSLHISPPPFHARPNQWLKTVPSIHTSSNPMAEFTKAQSDSGSQTQVLPKRTPLTFPWSKSKQGTCQTDPESASTGCTSPCHAFLKARHKETPLSL